MPPTLNLGPRGDAQIMKKYSVAIICPPTVGFFARSIERTTCHNARIRFFYKLCKHETQNWLLLHFTNAWPRPQGHPISPAELLDVLSPRGLNIRRMGRIWQSFRKKLASWHGNSHKTIIRQWKMWEKSHKTIIRQFRKAIRFPWFYVYFGDLCSII